jgi:hypothetical protein
MSIKIPVSFFAEIEKSIYNSYGNIKDPNSKSNPEQKEQHWKLSQYQTSNYTTET